MRNDGPSVIGNDGGLLFDGMKGGESETESSKTGGKMTSDELFDMLAARHRF